ncbi:MAG TPA: Csp1 family four helix bundle copper storage protein, partial [Methylocystis sp.]|nr:Csp1 family four helix bundle copper storage protein [Methylocystis sp.]
MERREFMTTLGAAAAVLSAMPAMAENAPVAHMHPPKYKALSDAAGKCVIDGDNCLRHCFGMLSMNDTSMAGCTTSSFDLIAACRALSTLAAVNSSSVPA